MDTIAKHHKYYKWEVLALLWLAFFLNQADRQIYNTLLSPIETDLNLTPAQAGLVATLFNLVFAILVPLSGLIADRASKKWIIVFSVILWSSATVASGLCTGLVLFIIFRSVATGMGEATFGPANYSTIADYHDETTRGTAMSIHQTSYYFGVIVSGWLAGYIAELWGWRHAFCIFGAVGVVLGLFIIWRLHDRFSKRVADENFKPSFEEIQKSSKKTVAKVTFMESLIVVFKTPTAVMLTLGFASLIFVLQGYLTWTPTFLGERFGLDLKSAGFDSMFYTHAAAFVGILIAGRVSDKLAAIKPSFRILMQSAGLLFAIPFIVLMGQANSLTLMFIGLAGFGFGRAFFDANTYPVLYDVIPRKYHASAAGVMLFIGFGVGSLSPLILGMMKPQFGLSTSISMLSLVWVIGSLLTFAGYKLFYMRDYKRASEIDKIENASA